MPIIPQPETESCAGITLYLLRGWLNWNTKDMTDGLKEGEPGPARQPSQAKDIHPFQRETPISEFKYFC